MSFYRRRHTHFTVHQRSVGGLTYSRMLQLHQRDANSTQNLYSVDAVSVSFIYGKKMVRSLQLAKYQCVQSDSLPKDYNNIKITQDAKCLLDVEQVCECLPLAGKQLHPTSS